MHKILDKQIRKFFGNPDSIPGELRTLLENIDRTYKHLDEDRALLERSLELSSKELIEINSKLQLEIKKVNFQALQLEEGKIKDEAILSSIGDGMIVTDRNGKVVIINSQAEIMLGWRLDEIKDKDMFDFVSVLDKDGGLVNKNDNPIYLAMFSGQKTTNSSYYYVRRDHTKFPVAITASPVTLGGEVTGTIFIFRDITREADVDRAKTEFVSLASHQMRTPLSTIRWYAEMLLSGDAGGLNDKQKEYLNIAYISTRRMIDLINSLLNVSRLELGTFSVEPELTDLREIADYAVKELEPQISRNQLVLKKHYDSSLPKINVDPKLMQIIFQNLISNAIKYTSAGGNIYVAIEKKGEEALVKVSDTGYGIPRYQQDQVFTKLFRADNIKEKDPEGTGLGLYIIRSIIDKIGGRIWFESVENKGTTFYATIPLAGMTKKQGSKQLNHK